MSNRRSSEAERGDASGRNTAGLTGAACPNALLATLLEAAQSAMAVINVRLPGSAARGPYLATRRARTLRSRHSVLVQVAGSGVRRLAIHALAHNAGHNIVRRRSWSAKDNAVLFSDGQRCPRTAADEVALQHAHSRTRPLLTDHAPGIAPQAGQQGQDRRQTTWWRAAAIPVG